MFDTLLVFLSRQRMVCLTLRQCAGLINHTPFILPCWTVSFSASTSGFSVSAVGAFSVSVWHTYFSTSKELLFFVEFVNEFLDAFKQFRDLWAITTFLGIKRKS